MIWAKRLSAAVLLFFTIAVISVYFAVRLSLPKLSGTIDTNDAVSSAVSLARDKLGTAVIKAKNHLDAAYALGFAHGQDRFFQLDLQRRFSAGELSALFGPVALEHDKNYRLHQMRKRAKLAFEAAPAEDKAILKTYVNGVNAGISSLDARPPEYLLLGQRPKPWVAEDSLLVSAFMFAQMTSATVKRDFARELILRSGGERLLNFIQPKGTIWDTAIDGSRYETPAVPDPTVWSMKASTQTAGLQATPPGPVKGSNSWAVSGALTAHGGALIANDPHLAFSLPHIWYRTQLNYELDTGEKIQVTGVSLPGLPSVAIGSNGHVAWGLTNSSGDWADLVAIDIKGDDYATPQGWQPMQVETESIEIAGLPAVQLDVKNTKWGPWYQLNGENFAWRWLAHDLHSLNPSNFRNLDQARTAIDVLRLAKVTGLSPFNMLAADSKGNMGWTIVGHLPKRGSVPTERVVSWRDADNSWQGWLPPSEYPEVTSKDRSRLWTANNRIIGGTDLSKIGHGQYELGTRGWLIEQDLANTARFDEAGMHRMMANNKAVLLESWQQYLVAFLSSRKNLSSIEAKSLDLLQSWSATASKDDTGYTIIRRFRDEFRIQINGAITAHLKKQGLLTPDFDTSALWLLSRQSEGALLRLRDEKPRHWLPNGVSSWQDWTQDMLNSVLDQLAKKHGGLEKARWGAENRLNMGHPIARSLPGFMADFINMPADELAGDSNMPLAQHPQAGQSMRFSVAPGREGNGFLVLPAGQSGHPLSPYYTSGHQDWLSFNQTPLLPGKPEQTLTLLP